MKSNPEIGLLIPQIYLPKTGIDLTRWSVIACDAKNKLSGDLIKDLAKWFKKDGYKAIERVPREKPDKLLDIIASMVPKEAQVDVAVTHGRGIALGSVELQEAERRTFDLLRRIESRVDPDPLPDGPVLPADVGVRQG